MTAALISINTNSDLMSARNIKMSGKYATPRNSKQDQIMPKKYTPNCSLQASRQIRRNRKKNLPRLNQLKELVGGMKCGKCNIPGKYLDGHHVDENHKFRPISVLVGRRASTNGGNSDASR
jgi:hypothetical protein